MPTGVPLPAYPLLIVKHLLVSPFGWICWPPPGAGEAEAEGTLEEVGVLEGDDEGVTGGSLNRTFHTVQISMTLSYSLRLTHLGWYCL